MKKFLSILTFIIVLTSTALKANADNFQSLSVTTDPTSHQNYTYDNQNYNQVQGDLGLAMEVTDYISTANATNPQVKFYYYIPPILLKSSNPYPLIVTLPGMDGEGEGAVYTELKNLADTKGYAILAPTFKHNDNDFIQQKSYQYPGAWSGAALDSMIEKAKNNGLNYSKLYMVGFSAGGQFVSRYSLLHPEKVDACAILSSGARVKPTQKTNVKYFVGVGTSDTEYRKENANIFYRAAVGLGIPVVYRTYPMDHTLSSDEINDVANFFEQVRTGRI